jgi:hypothetical protein
VGYVWWEFREGGLAKCIRRSDHSAMARGMTGGGAGRRCPTGVKYF